MVMLITKCFPQDTKKTKTCRCEIKKKEGKKETIEEREREESLTCCLVFGQII